MTNNEVMNWGGQWVTINCSRAGWLIGYIKITSLWFFLCIKVSEQPFIAPYRHNRIRHIELANTIPNITYLEAEQTCLQENPDVTLFELKYKPNTICPYCRGPAYMNKLVLICKSPGCRGKL